MGVISLLGNLLWIVMGGLVSALLWLIVGILLCITIVGFPIGIQCFKIAELSFVPFGKKIDYGEQGVSGWACCGNILWLPIGLVLAINHLFWALTLVITIVGIPFAWQHVKLAQLSLFPFGATIFDDDANYERLPHYHYYEYRAVRSG